MKKMTGITTTAICLLTAVTGLAVGSLFVMQSTGVINVIADEVKVVFRNYDNTFLYKDVIPAGSNAEYKGEPPHREGNDMYEYTFVSWDKSLYNVTEDTVFYAQFQNKLKECKVSFQNWNHKELYVDYVPKGQTAEYVGAAPTKESDEHYSYTFSGWDKPLDNVMEDRVITATFDSKPVEYAVTFKNGDQVLYVDHVAYLGTAVYKGLTPVKAGTTYAEYVFTGWDKPLIGVGSDFETQAVFEERPIVHTARFYNYDNTLLYETGVSHGGTAVYMGATPQRPAEGQFAYLFAGWNHPLNNITGDTIFIAQYTATERQIPVHFYNYDGTYLSTSYATYGKPAYYKGDIPYRPEDEKYVYEFAGWDRDISYVTDETTVRAVFDKELRTFKCVFKNYDGTLLYTSYVTYGETAVYYGDTPVKDGDVNTVFRFIGWNRELTNITQDTIFYAEFEVYKKGGGGETKYYVVDFYNYDGTLLDFDVVEAGKSASYEWETPTRPNDPNHSSYQFVGWDQPIDEVTKNMSVFAQYTAEWNSYWIVTYRSPYEDLLYEDFIYRWSESHKSTYKGPLYDYLLPENGFRGWDKDLLSINESTTTRPLPEKEEQE